MRLLGTTLLSTAAVLLFTFSRPILASPSPNAQGLSGSIPGELDVDFEFGLQPDGPLENRDFDDLLSNKDDEGGVNKHKKRQAATTSPASTTSPSSAATSPAAPGAGDENYIEACPNPEYQGINATVTCLNFTDPTMPKGYGGQTCISLTNTPLHVGSPQGISSARMFGNMNCTLYKTENCLPDSRENGFIIPPGGARSLPLPSGPNDPYAFDDETVAFNCRPL